MMMKSILALLISGLITNLSAAEATPAFIQDCMDCHGENGVSPDPNMPTIAGASEAYIEAALYTYKDEMRKAYESKYLAGDLSRPPTDMKKVVDILSEDQVSQAAKYFAARPFVAAKQDFNSELVALGKKVHEIRCKKCHEDGGSSPDDDAGILAGQWTQYLEQTTKDMLDGSREVEKKMLDKLKKMSEQELEAVFAYYASQQ